MDIETGRLSKEEHNEIFLKLERQELKKITAPLDGEPLTCVFLAGQPGSGKGSLMAINAQRPEKVKLTNNTNCRARTHHICSISGFYAQALEISRSPSIPGQSPPESLPSQSGCPCF